MSEYKVNVSRIPCSDTDSSGLDFLSSPNSHRFTSPALVECEDVPPGDLVRSKRRALPLELIEYIIELFYQRYRTFCALRSLSLANSQFRLLALRRYMTSLDIHSANQLASLSHLHTSLLSRNVVTPDCVGFHWVRSLTARSGALASAPWRPSLMTSLLSLHVSFATEVKSTQKIRANQIFEIALMNTPMTRLTSLALTGLCCIDISLLSVVSRGFPGLLSLYLSCSEHLDVSCCWSCFEESCLAVVHSPIPNHFPTVASLTHAFAKALEPLTKLTDLHLGIFLSDEEMLEHHIDHYDSPRAYSHTLRNTNQNAGMNITRSEPSRSASFEHASYTEDEEDELGSAENATFSETLPFPHGPEMCSICSIVFPGSDVRTRELEASLALAQKLKSLRTIAWSSFFAWKLPFGDEAKIGDWQRATKTYVLRRGGRVRIRRRPWD